MILMNNLILLHVTVFTSEKDNSIAGKYVKLYNITSLCIIAELIHADKYQHN